METPRTSIEVNFVVVENSKEFENDLKLRDFNINDNILIEAIIVHRGHRGQYYIEAIQISEEIEDGLFAPNLWTLQDNEDYSLFHRNKTEWFKVETAHSC